jgi:hypothetical protein
MKRLALGDVLSASGSRRAYDRQGVRGAAFVIQHMGQMRNR